MKYALIALAAVLLFAQRPARLTIDPKTGEPMYPQWEVKTVMPHETTPARYMQVQPAELQQLAYDGWELVAVTPYVYLNEERGTDGQKMVVTQTYPAYFFKRLRAQR